MFSEIIRKESLNLAYEITALHEQLKNYPDEELFCEKQGPQIKWFIRNAAGKSLLSKKKRSYARYLAEKKYYQLKLRDLEQELKLLEHYNNHHNPLPSSDRLLKNPTYAELLLSPESSTDLHNQRFLVSDMPTLSPTSSPLLPPDHYTESLLEVPWNGDPTLWSKHPYAHNDSYSDGLKHRTISGHMVRSKSESLIATCLYNHCIPFRYEGLLLLNHHEFFPDFTILHPRTNRVIFWEHFGLIDSPDYRENAYEKLKFFGNYGIYPSINLITTYETETTPLDIVKIEEFIRIYLT